MSASRVLLLLVLLITIVGTVFAQAEILVGDSVIGEASEIPVDYELFLEEGQTVGISLSSETFDTYLKLFAEDGGLIAENDDLSDPDNPSETDSYLIYSASVSGTVTVSVTGFNLTGPSGAYSLSVTELELLDQLDAGILRYGEASTIAPNGAAEISFSFEGAAGDAVSIFANSLTNEDTRMSLLDSEGNPIASNDDSGFSTNSAIRRFPLPAAGTYRVVVTGFGGARLFGELELKLEESAVLLLNEGAQVLSLSPESTADVVMLDVEADTPYIITINLSQRIATPLMVRTQEAEAGFPGTRLSILGTNFISFAFASRNTGRVSIEVELSTFDQSVEVTIAARAQ